MGKRKKGIETLRLKGSNAPKTSLNSSIKSFSADPKYYNYIRL